MPIRVFLISNFLILLRTLSDLIESHPETFSLVGIAENYEPISKPNVNLKTDVLVLDIDNNTQQALSLIEMLNTVTDVKILLLTRLEDIALQDKAVLCGAKGFIYHNTTPELFLTAIEKVHRGEIWLNRAATGRMLGKLSRANNPQHDSPNHKIELLTERELEIFTIIVHCKGEAGKAIADKLNISESTLRNHLTSIYEKLGVNNRHGLLAFAFQNKFTDQAL